MFRRGSTSQTPAPAPAPATAAPNAQDTNTTPRRRPTRMATFSSFTLPFTTPAKPALSTRPAIPSKLSSPSISSLPLSPAETPEVQPKPVEVEEPKVTVAVIGASGSGKTTFINKAGNLDLPVGHGIQSCTQTVQSTTPFGFEGHQVTLIDTPGFDDDTITDVDVLKMITTFLSDGYANKNFLTGIIFLHRISDRRVGGVSRRTIKMFKELCGDEALKNVVFATTMWGSVDEETGEARDAELRNEDMFFKSLIEKGARLVRHENTEASAQSILRSVIGNKPLPLQIQMEMVDQKKDILQTAAVRELRRDTEEQKEKHEQEKREFIQEMKETVSVREQEVREEVLKEQQEIQDNVHRAEKAAVEQEEQFMSEKKQLESSLAQEQDSKRGGYEERAADISKLQDDFIKASIESAKMRKELWEKIDEAERQAREKHSQPSTGCFASYGASVDGFFSVRRER